MSSGASSANEYAVPTYRAPDDVVWYHVLHGSVPGHQIDFILRPELPQGALRQLHFSHLSRSIKYIEPCHGSDFAFALVNLSRDDTQHEPGRGGVGVILGMRVHGAKDHVGRPDPPFSHAIVSVGRELDQSVLEEVAVSFYHHVLGGAGLDGKGTDFYKAFATRTFSSPVTSGLLSHYINRFSDLPRPGFGSATHIWQADASLLPRRVVIWHDHNAPFPIIARCAARIAAMLYRSDIRWTSITTGREADIPHGVSIRLLPRQAAQICGFLPGEQGDRVMPMKDVPEREADIARQLFNATLVQRAPAGSPAFTKSKAAPDRMSSRAHSGPVTTEELDAEFPTLPQLGPPESKPAGNVAEDDATKPLRAAPAGETAPPSAAAQTLRDKALGQNKRGALITVLLLAVAAAVPAAFFHFRDSKSNIPLEPGESGRREPATQTPPRAAERSDQADPSAQVPKDIQPKTPDLQPGAATATPPNERPAQAMASPRRQASQTGSDRIGGERAKASRPIASHDDVFGNPNLAQPRSPRSTTKPHPTQNR